MLGLVCFMEGTLRCENDLDHGIVFFESQTLPEKSADETSTTAFWLARIKLDKSFH